MRNTSTMPNMNSLLDWGQLRLVNGDQKKAFEELCYQIAHEEFASMGRIISIDDSGGGDGVEFYLEFPNGDIWGWQCKYFDRLSEGNRKGQIKSSLQKAYKVHKKKLKKWVLCKKSSLTSDERRWFEKILPSSTHKKERVLPNNHNVLLESWGNSEILLYLKKYPDIWRFFFNARILSKNWFFERGQLVLQSQEAKQKYLSDLHIEEHVDLEVFQMLGGEKLAEDIQSRMDVLDVTSFEREFRDALGATIIQSSINRCKGIQAKAKKLASDDLELISNGIRFLNGAIRTLRSERFSAKERLDLVQQAKAYHSLLIDRLSLWGDLKERVTASAISWDKE
ncbi:MAG: hypothetical protein AAF570_11300, partial [Bacteroidota bacterium]